MAKMTLEEREKYARIILATLGGSVLAAKAQGKKPTFEEMRVTYLALAKAIKYPAYKWPGFTRLVGHTLADMRAMLDHFDEGVPLIEVMVVRKDNRPKYNGYPGKGFSAPCPEYDVEMDPAKKKKIVDAHFAEVWKYGHRWADVIDKLGWRASNLIMYHRG